MASALVVALLALPSSASAATYKIKALSNNTFSPSVLTVNQGNLVKWINKGGYHEVDITKPSGYVTTNPSTDLGKMAERTVVAGSFAFVCTFHASSGMRGTLNVKPTLSRSGSTVTVRLGPVLSSYRHTIERRKGSGTWTSSTTTAGADSKAFSLSRGTWSFRAKLVRVSDGTSSSYSPVVSISVP
ncbi:MAG: hypothetical protein M3395_02800 [Chloroflexota bacterium]|nr:hypothetical protein [Chloroflexota bacterium]